MHLTTYVFHKAPHVSPIVGGRKVDYIRIRIEALSLWLAREDLDDIETAYPFDICFPYNLLSGYDKRGASGLQDIWTANICGIFDHFVVFEANKSDYIIFVIEGLRKPAYLIYLILWET
ncbi:norsolorinic acid reductase [Colletotrichum lupini]|uniref:Norsolorinic acid reductase n=1 Tax=Colletotrichum lupini TaxID=145971 RepID=A0A9Q8SSJ9_9PEZI|nr:norsolorinic acid reductase [Colletotrichum lupini]UQC82726.1 norsolorinic acid reductase [Colletotrichum lupini]